MDRFIANTGPLQRVDPYENLVETLTATVIEGPPDVEPAKPWKKSGIVIGPTSTAYLFYRLASLYPDLNIEGKTLLAWSKAYLQPPGPSLPPTRAFSNEHCGVLQEEICHTAVSAVILKDIKLAEKVLDYRDVVLADGGFDELINGRAGFLYILRMVKAAFPELPTEALTKEVIDKVLSRQPWMFVGKEFWGAGHGSIGILVQLALSGGIVVESTLEHILESQLPDGQFMTSATGHSELVQFCHGAPGVVISLLTLRPFYPTLHARIDRSIDLARKVIWKEGILRKTPCLCHGTSGNALALEDAQFDHFLSLTTLKAIRTGIKDGTLIATDNPFSLYFGWAGNAWTWAVADKKLEKTYLGFNDL